LPRVAASLTMRAFDAYWSQRSALLRPSGGKFANRDGAGNAQNEQ
jgi:hypothetical protein